MKCNLLVRIRIRIRILIGVLNRAFIILIHVVHRNQYDAFLRRQPLENEGFVHADVKHGGAGVRFAQQQHAGLTDFYVANDGSARKREPVWTLQINPANVRPVQHAVQIVHVTVVPQLFHVILHYRVGQSQFTQKMELFGVDFSRG